MIKLLKSLVKMFKMAFDGALYFIEVVPTYVTGLTAAFGYAPVFLFGLLALCLTLSVFMGILKLLP